MFLLESQAVNGYNLVPVAVTISTGVMDEEGNGRFFPESVTCQRHERPLMRQILCIAAIISILQSADLPGAVIWEDTFDGPNLDTIIWTPEVGGWGWGNNELQYYTNRIDGAAGANAYIENGNLVIEARQESFGGNSFTSARLITKNALTYKYGTLEARIQMANLANGLWPAFWLLGTSIDQVGWPVCGELDIMEMGSAGAISEGAVNRKITAAAHWEHNGSTADYGGSTYTATAAHDNYHLFKLEWTPSNIRAYLDGAQFWSIDISGGAGSDLEEFHEQMFIILNMAVGGTYTGITNPNHITAPLPAKMYIDWIRLTDNEWTEYYNIKEVGDTTETGYYGVLTETTPVNGSVLFGTNAELFLWNNLTSVAATAYEGTEAWSFNAGAGQWFGAGVYCTPLRNMENFTDGELRFHMKTTTGNNIGIGIKSSDGVEQWIRLISGGLEYGLIRDGAWHEVAIPLRLYDTIDFAKIEQLFMFNHGDKVPSSSLNVSFDNMYWVPTPGDGDFDNDGNANLIDFAILSTYWLETNCWSFDDCENADTNGDGHVDIDDLAVLVSDWLIL